MTKTLQEILKEQLTIANRQHANAIATSKTHESHREFNSGRISAYEHCLELLNETTAAEQPKKVNTLARLEGSSTWTYYGDVTLYEAARREAIKTATECPLVDGYAWIIEVMRENDPDIKPIMVKVMTYITTKIIDPRRGAD